MFILKLIVNEKWSLEKSLPCLIRRVILVPSFNNFHISVVLLSEWVYVYFENYRGVRRKACLVLLAE